MSGRRVLFYVQHLLGIGHLRRAATLTRALARAGLEVTLVSGGHEVPGLDVGGAAFAQLPPTRAVDLYFRKLVDAEERPIDDAWRARRRDLLLDIYRRVRPHVVMFELFPFGRRQMRFELVPLLETAIAETNRPLVISSVRDILVTPDKPTRADEMLALIARYFDRVLVHGDPGFIAFDHTFPAVKALGAKLFYTGYVVDDKALGPKPASAADRAKGEVVVSAGGGAVGENLLATAIAARPATRLAERPWRVLVGPSVTAAGFAALAAQAAPGVVVERARADFPELLAKARLSISQGGYNTLMEILATRCPAVVVPYAGGLETEQTLRSALLAERGYLQVIEEKALAPAVLAAAVDRGLDQPPRPVAGIDLSGGATSAHLISDWAENLAWS